MRRTVIFGGLSLLLALGACSGDMGNSTGNAVTAMPDATNVVTNAPTVQPLPPAASNDYPPCSTTVKDHCVEK